MFAPVITAPLTTPEPAGNDPVIRSLNDRRTTSPGSTRGKRTVTLRLVSEGCASLLIGEVFSVPIWIESGRYSIPGGSSRVITTSRAAVSPLFLNAIEAVKVEPKFRTG